MMINLFKDGKKINFMNGDGEKAFSLNAENLFRKRIFLWHFNISGC